MLPSVSTRQRLLKAARRSLHMQRITGNKRPGLSLFQSPELKLFLKLVKSPSHLMFVASNVAILVHLLFYSTLRQKQRMEEFDLQMEELERYIDVIEDLDKQTNEIQRQIAQIKLLRQKEFSRPEKKLLDIKDSHAQKKLTKRYKAINEQVDSARDFLQRRKNFSVAFSDANNIQRLFMNHEDVSEEQNEIPSETLTYTSPVQNTIMAVSSQIVKSFLTELNLRSSLMDDDTLPQQSFLVRDDLFQSMKHDDEKIELMTKLLTGFKESGTKVTTFPASLNGVEVLNLMNETSSNEVFNSNELKRNDIFAYKSGRWLNYEHSDTFKNILAIPSLVYGTNLVNNDEYLRKFERLFATYEKEDHPFKHLKLVLGIAKVLISKEECLPNFAIFQYLLDNLGRVGLFNYQSMIYDSLPDLSVRQTVLADNQTKQGFASKDLMHLISLVQKDPEFFKSFVEYQVPRKEVQTFLSLMGLLKPTQPSFSPSSIIPRPMWAYETSSATTLDKPILVGLDTIESTIKACVDLNELKLIDKVLNTLFFNLFYSGDGIRVSLNGAKPDLVPVMGGQTLPSRAILKLLSPEMLELLGRTYIASEDKVRGKWLLPILRTATLETKNEHLRPVLAELSTLAEGDTVADKWAPVTRKVRTEKSPVLVSGSKNFDLHGRAQAPVIIPV